MRQAYVGVMNLHEAEVLTVMGRFDSRLDNVDWNEEFAK